MSVLQFSVLEMERIWFQSFDKDFFTFLLFSSTFHSSLFLFDAGILERITIVIPRLG